MSTKDHIHLDFAVAAITVGARHRKDLGDIGELAASIERIGLLNLITITPDGVLICGARRLAAVKHLGWRAVNVWVRTDISERLATLMAEREDVISIKAYNKVEKAALYEELKAEIAADAARRQVASRFGGQNPCSRGASNLDAPCDQAKGRIDVQAAAVVGGIGRMTLEKINAVKHLAADETRAAAFREQAARGLDEIARGGKVDAIYERLTVQARLDDLADQGEDPELTPQAQKAARHAHKVLTKQHADKPLTVAGVNRLVGAASNRVKHVNRRTSAKVVSPEPAEPEKKTRQPRKKTPREFEWAWGLLADWPAEYDVAAIAREVSAQGWAKFEATMAKANAFTAAVNAERAALAQT